MKRLLWRALLLVGLMVLLSTTVCAEGETVRELRTSCAVEADGACTVTLDVTLELPDASQGFSVPIVSGARDVSCSLPYETRSGDGCRLLALSGLHSGSNQFTVRYRLPETVRDNGESQEFTVQLLYPAWPCAIIHYEAEVTLPGRFESMPVFFSGYYGDLIDNYMEISVDEGTIRAVLNEKQTLQDHEAMSVKLELPRGFFDLRFLAGKTARVDKLLFWGLLVFTALYWLIFLRNLPILPKRQAMPPEGGNAGEIPYLLTDRPPDLALMVVQWASLGYLTITRSRKGGIRLIQQIDMDTERKSYEGEIFRTLFTRGGSCSVRSAEYLKARRLADEKPRRFWQPRIFAPKGSPLVLRLLALAAGLALCLAGFDLWVASKSWRWPVIVPLTLLGGAACLGLQDLGGFLLRRHSLRTGVLALLSALGLLILGRNSGLTSFMLLNILLQLTVGLLLRCGGRRTADGAAMAAELLGYRRWLLSASTQQLETNLAADPQFFYRVLPFADALRVSRLLAGSLEKARLEDCDWLIWEGKPARTVPVFYARYCRLMAGLRGERDPAAPLFRPRTRQAPVSTRVTPPVRRSAAGRGRTPARRGNNSRTGSVQRRNRP